MLVHIACLLDILTCHMTARREEVMRQIMRPQWLLLPNRSDTDLPKACLLEFILQSVGVREAAEDISPKMLALLRKKTGSYLVT